MPLWATRLLAATVVLGMLLVAGIGFASSYDNLRSAAIHKGFTPGLADWIPIGVDGAIIAFLALDLVLLACRIPVPLLRFAAHGMTAATVVLNATSGDQPIAEDPVRAGWHGLMPLLFIIGVEAGRRLLVHVAQLQAGTVRDRIPLHRWVLSPFRTPKLYRRMRLANVRSYREMVQREQDLDGYRVWLGQQYKNKGGIDAADETERLPMTMAGRGFTVAEALALPEKWETEQAEREEQKAERQRRQAEQAAERDKKDRLRKIRDEGEIQQAQYATEAETGTARAAAEQTQAEAEARTETTRIRTQHLRQQAERAAEAEAEALESERAAAAWRKAAEDREKAEAAEHRTEQEHLRAETAKQEERRKAAQKKAETDRLVTEQKRAEAQAAEEDRKKAEAEAATTKAERQTAEHRRAAAEAEAAALEAEDVIRLSSRERKARRVARMILTAGSVDAVPLQTIEQELNASRTTAGEIRQEAEALIENGYPNIGGGQLT
ncbi:hypothetical protein AOB60_43120 [Streptomyces noursei]|uniref:DUF2637 domain-containing protein n=1 Tax=Streptomyces noursei TaxID=1971 RepID=A0A2N8P444_STRNR|nr:hypothetical protein AOB60_43120 [Streptomyces noursei]